MSGQKGRAQVINGIYSCPEVVDAMEIVDQFWLSEDAAGADPRLVFAIERCYDLLGFPIGRATEHRRVNSARLSAYRFFDNACRQVEKGTIQWAEIALAIPKEAAIFLLTRLEPLARAEQLVMCHLNHAGEEVEFDDATYCFFANFYDLVWTSELREQQILRQVDTVRTAVQAVDLEQRRI